MCGVIVVDAESFRSTCHGRWCLYTWSCLDSLITMLNSVNCSTVIYSPTVKYLCSWEKPLVKPMAPGSIVHYIDLPSTSYFWCRLFCYLYFPIYTTKITKNILLSLLDLTSLSDREGIDNPFIALVARFLFVFEGTRDLRVTSYWIDTLVLKN